MKKPLTILGLLLAFIALVATGCGSSAAPQLGEQGKDTFVFIYTDG